MADPGMLRSQGSQVVGTESSTGAIQLSGGAEGGGRHTPRRTEGTRGLSSPFLRGAPGGELPEEVVPPKGEAREPQVPETGTHSGKAPVHVFT